MSQHQCTAAWATKTFRWLVVGCVACLPVKAYGQDQYVQPVDWTKYAAKTGVRSGDAFGQTLTTVLQNESRYELNWVDSNHQIVNSFAGWQGADCYDPAFSNYPVATDESTIWPMAGVAYSTAALLKTGTYSPSVGGLSAADALHRAELAIRGVAFTNYANAPSGHSWSGAEHMGGLWAADTAEAAWWLWDSLSSQTKVAVAKMVEYEANRLIPYTVPYFADKNGNVVYPGDTKAEENAYKSHVLAVAQAMMPNHPNVAAWRQKASELQVSAYSRQSDLTSAAPVDGKPVKDWLNGFNVFNDGVALNHSIIHPDYMVGDARRTISTIDVSLAGQYVPQSMVYNVDLLYHGLTQVNFAPGADTAYGTGKTIAAPGGTIYKRTAAGGYDAAVYYPEGTDYSYNVMDCYLNMDLTSHHLGVDAGNGSDAMGWAQARVDQMLALQTRPGHDGNVYQDGDWVGWYPAKDENLFVSNAGAWMQWWLMDNGLMSPVGDHWGAVAVPEPSPIAALLGGGFVLLAWRMLARNHKFLMQRKTRIGGTVMESQVSNVAHDGRPNPIVGQVGNLSYDIGNLRLTSDSLRSVGRASA